MRRFKMRCIQHIILLISLCITISGAHGNVTPEEAKQLTSNLTPLGATRSGNKNGNIPAWTTDQLSDEEHLQWRKTFQNEKPLFIIHYSLFIIQIIC